MSPPLRTSRAKDSIENRRIRGEISCAECRRHKLKCDKSIPCSTCVRKGCQAICPNGTLSPVHGARPTAPSESAHNSRVAALSKRIRQLEDALQISHSTVSNAPHPLLAEDLLQIKRDATPVAAEKSDSSSADVELVDTFGTLAVTRTGSEFYLGGPSQSYLSSHIGSPDLSPESDLSLELAPPVSYLSRTFPFTPLYLPVREIQAYIEEKLPSYARASALAEAYLENLSWFFRPVDREQIMEELIPLVYKKKRQTSGSANSSNSSQSGHSDSQPSTDPHALALLLIVFAAGAAADLTLPPWNDEAELYYHLARAALSLKPVFEGAGLHAVQTIALIGAYTLFSCRKPELEGTWKILSFSLSLAASIGLNRDPAHFKLPPKLIQRRRRVFWELFSLDTWKSVSTGRPMTFTPSVVDCELPEDTDAIQVEDGIQKADSIWFMRYRYIKDIMMDVTTKLTPIRAVKYSEILALDQKIREYNPQGIFGTNNQKSSSKQYDTSIHDVVRRTQLGLHKDMTILLLHRVFFARALLLDPVNPVRTQFGPSFLSTYRSAASMIQLVQEHFDLSGHFLIRCWPIWGHSLHAAVTLGSIAACGASSALAPQAYIHFSTALELFSKVQMHPIVKSEVPALMRLREQALEALAKHGNEVVANQLPPYDPQPIKTDQEFNPIASLGKMVRKSFEGAFGTNPLPLNGWTVPDAQQTTGYSPAAGFSIPFSHPYQERLDPGGSHQQSSGQNSTSGSESAPSPSQNGYADGSNRQSPIQRLETSMTTQEIGPRTDSVHDNVSYMQVDQNPYPAEGHGPDDMFYHPQAMQFAGGSSGSSNPDMLSTYTTLSDLPSSNSIPSSGLTPSSGSNFIPSTQTQAQTQLHPSPSSSSLIQPPYTVDPLAYGTPSRLSPRTFFSSDFDVSFDMRSSVGQENVLQLLPQDMEAWRAVLQDSRFFGILSETMESERSTPRLM